LWYIGVGDANTSTNGGGGDAWSRQSFLGRLNYAFNEKYLLTATLRSDGTSRLPSQNRWQQYPSFGAAWILSRESFLQNQELFDFLKLRASYGKVGNDQIPTDSYTPEINGNSPYPYQGSGSPATNGGRILRIIDPNITWETTTEYDIALEFSLIQSKLTGEVNYYNKRITDLLVNIGTVGSAGDANGLIFQNVAAVENKGIEVALNWRSNIGENWSYTVGGNVTFNKNTVLDVGLGRATQGGSVGGQGPVTSTDDNGHPIGSFYVLRTLGVFNSIAEVNAYVDAEGDRIQPTAKPGDFKYKDVNEDGQIDTEDYVFAGSYQPVAYLGINFGVNYKNFDFTMDIYGNVGNEVYNGKKAARYLGTDNVEADVVYNRWTASNRSQTEPGANAGNLPASDYFVESGDFFRINNITIGYKFPSSVLNRLKISSLRVFATTQNLLTIKKYSGFTAELPGSPISAGIEMDSYPTTRTFAMGLNVGF
jgi:TonB-linked SusC/RagA family outer membrane protein